MVEENKTETTIKNYDAQEMLQNLITSGKIDLSNVQIEMNKRNKILEQHNKPIWKGSNGRWYIYLPDDTKKSGRKQVVKSTEEKLKDELTIRYYQDRKNQRILRKPSERSWSTPASIHKSCWLL